MKIHHHVAIRLCKRNDPAWVKRRVPLFVQYTYHSLMAQSVQGFIVWIQMDEYGRRLLSETDIPPGPHIVVTVEDHYREILKHIPEGCDWVYSTRLDSDDVYRYDALELAHKVKPRPGRISCSMFCDGYTHDVRSGRWGHYTCQSPPFHTLMLPASMYRDPVAMKRDVQHRHGAVRYTYPTVVLPASKFCVLRHGSNTETDAKLKARGIVPKPTPKNHPCRGRTLEQFIRGEC